MLGLTTLFFMACTTLLMTSSATPTPESKLEKRAPIKGVAVTAYQRDVDWESLKRVSGIDFGYVMATTGLHYKNPWFQSQYTECRDAGLFCGAFHVAAPNNSSGATQAKYFIRNGGDWTRDGRTLPGALSLGYHTYETDCYGLSDSEMVSWIRDFSGYYHSKTGRYPVIVTSYDWWKMCTNKDLSFGRDHPLWQARTGKRPDGWRRSSFLQDAVPGATAMVKLEWNGSIATLTSFALR